MTLKPPKDINAPMSQEELFQLHRVVPDAVRSTPDGTLWSPYSRAEIFRLQTLYPTHDPTQSTSAPLVRTGDRERDILLARYPSMRGG